MFYTFWAMVLFLFLFSIIAYLLLPTFIKMWQKMLKRPPSERAKRAEYVRMITCYLLITYFLLTYYLLITYFFTYLLLNQDVSKIAPEMRPRSERSERSTFILRTYYVLITYLLLSLLLARNVHDTCFVLAWCLHGSCLGFACYLICIWWHSFRETHVCVCLYVYLLLPKFIKMRPKLFKRPPPRSEWSERSTFVWFTYYVLITYFLLTYYLHNTHFFTYLSLTYYSALTHTYQDVSKTAPEMRPRSERSERSTFV